MEATIRTFPPNELLSKKYLSPFQWPMEISVASHSTQPFLPHVTWILKAAEVLIPKSWWSTTLSEK